MPFEITIESPRQFYMIWNVLLGLFMLLLLRYLVIPGAIAAGLWKYRRRRKQP